MPAFLDVRITPNPVEIIEPFQISVLVVDVVQEQKTMEYMSGEFRFGEV